MFVVKYILILLQALFVLGQGAGIQPEENHVAVNTLPNLTNEKVNLVTTLKADDDQPSKNTTTTTTIEPPKTTTEAPKPPTEPPKPTTETPKPTSTPSTTTVAPITSTAIPTTSAPKSDHWLVIGDNGTVCIIAKMDIKLDLKLSHTSKDISMKIPKEATVNGTCGNDEQSMVLTWNQNSLSLNFKSNETVHKYHLDSVVVDIKAENVTVQLNDVNITLFETAMNHSYSCSYSDPLKFTSNNETVQFYFSNIELEAFKKDNSTKFSNVYACPPETPDIVPIVVGCALTVLVVVVLIAYLYGRRRTQARGYLSM